MADGLSEAEHEVMKTTVLLWNGLCDIIPDGPSRRQDLDELAAHIHVIQRTVMSQAAGRAHPTQYRMLGGRV
jgi:hypothetical protein